MRTVIGWMAALFAGAMLGAAAYEIVLSEPLVEPDTSALVVAEADPLPTPTVYRTKVRKVVEPTPTVTVIDEVAVTHAATPAPTRATPARTAAPRTAVTRATAPNPRATTQQSAKPRRTASPTKSAKEREHGEAEAEDHEREREDAESKRDDEPESDNHEKRESKESEEPEDD